MSFAKSFALIPRYSCHNFFKISSLIFYFSNFRGTLEADDVIGKKWALLSLFRYVNVPLNRFINAKYVFSSDADSYEDGDGQSF